VPPELHYPDVTMPVGWPYFRQGLQIRLVPPGRTLDDTLNLIVVSPLVPRQDGLPPPEDLIEATIFAESRQRFEVIGQKGPTPARSRAGLDGVSYDVLGYVRPRSQRERRVYVVYADALCYYSLSSLATESAFDEHALAFWEAARSVRPFRGRRLAPTGPSPVALLYSD
jgi:hypothetical protein